MKISVTTHTNGPRKDTNMTNEIKNDYTAVNGRVARLEDVLRKDYERYRDMAKDEVRFPVFMNRQKFQNVADAIERIVDCFDFVDDVRNEENLPDVNVSKLTGRHYSAEEDAINLQHNKHYGEK
jgi:hypothetical protein